MLIVVALASVTACAHAPKIPVASKATMADAAITAAVKTALLNDPRVDATDVMVSTEAGVVKLAGSQPSRDAAAEVLSIVRGVQGVRDVQSSITVVAGERAESDPQR